jgi:hypothetical protein
MTKFSASFASSCGKIRQAGDLYYNLLALGKPLYDDLQSGMALLLVHFIGVRRSVSTWHLRDKKSSAPTHVEVVDLVVRPTGVELVPLSVRRGGTITQAMEKSQRDQPLPASGRLIPCCEKRCEISGESRGKGGNSGEG